MGRTTGTRVLVVAVGIYGLLSLGAVAERAMADGLVEQCAGQELVKPEVTLADLAEPGTRYQGENVAMTVAATPEECRGVVERMVQFEVIKKERRRIGGKLRRKIIRLHRFGFDGYTPEVAGTYGLSGAADPHRGKWVYYHCSVGQAITRVRLNLRVIVTNLATHQEAGRQVFHGPLLEIDGINQGRGC